MGRRNGRLANALGSVLSVVILVVAVDRDSADDPHERGPELSGKQIDIGLQVLDHQLLDKDGRRCGNVDDLAIEGGVGETTRGRRDPRRAWLLGPARRLDRALASWIGAADACESPGAR